MMVPHSFCRFSNILSKGYFAIIEILSGDLFYAILEICRCLIIFFIGNIQALEYFVFLDIRSSMIILLFQKFGQEIFLLF